MASASCSTKPWVDTAPKVTLTLTESSVTDTSVTYSWTLVYYSSSAPSTSSNRDYTVVIDGETIKSSSFNINGKKGTITIDSGSKTISKTTSARTISFSCTFEWKLTWSGSYKGTQSASGSMSIPAKTSYTVDFNANGGSGAPTSQIKWHGEDLKLSSSTPTRTGYTFLGWNGSSSATTVTHNAGGWYGYDSSVTFYAVWRANTFTITFDANGGTGAPSNQTKTYGTDLTLSSTKPSKTNYNFLGWGLTSSATTASYQPGSKYTTNSAVTLYAIWELAYTNPRINSVVVTRCDSVGNDNEEGTNFKITFSWETDKEVSSVLVSWGTDLSKEVSASGTSGSVSEILGSNSMSSEKTYDISVIVSDEVGSTTLKNTLPAASYSIDFLRGGKGAAFGKPAATANLLDILWNARVRSDLTVDGVIHGESAVLSGNFEIGGFLTMPNGIWNRSTLSINGTVSANDASFDTLHDSYDCQITNGLTIYESAGIDPDTTLDHLILTHVNTPNGGFMYVKTEFYSSKSTTSNRMQTAFPYQNVSPPYYRYYYDGAWSSWMEMGLVRHSTSEQATGHLWVDDKPIYRKTIAVDVSTTGSNVIIANVSNIESVVSISGSYSRSQGQQFPPVYWYSSSNTHTTWVDASGNLTVRTTSAITGYITLEYTKTTD